MREKKQKYIYTHRKNVDKHFHLNDNTLDNIICEQHVL